MKNIFDPKDFDEEIDRQEEYSRNYDDDQQMIEDYWNSEEGQQHAENID